ncbi:MULTISPECIES: glutamate 5-kinase [Chloracidobacterium]|jgi:glutamate 5-kinase|uniref:Glutamate 5-kinase n=1 Tax=Chloracidobacterium thermophilum (strain B) TaxID=981222 RepID=G2LJV1_CHLTF|nr:MULTISPECIES: glutamate 5-kinase [Chloracidobacterium]AEP13118.1 glutamate 5-kinase [Chloracidobacterium thermophilum B]QUV80382.1 glutamate 5-kinase [Chloracidobacterium thermophilum]QUV83087.1 glutamate 5-kinase [Chloracidobacterium sp. D]
MAQPSRHPGQDAAAARAALAAARRIVVKVGSNVLVEPEVGLVEAVLRHLVGQCLALRAGGRTVVIVSSGAVACGMTYLRTHHLPLGRDLSFKQAAAAIGQPFLMRYYEQAFAPVPVAQVLLTYDDARDRERFLNARHTLRTLLTLGVVPIINENDTVATAEIKFGDNDFLSALVANIVDADLLVLLSDVDGLFDRDPKQYPEARQLSFVPEVTVATLELASSGKSAFGTGGMQSKLTAARTAARFGVTTVIVNGRASNILERVIAGDDVGTLFPPATAALGGRKRWIAALRPKGTLTLDAGAVRAVVTQGKSVLPSGIIRVTGRFAAGDVVACCDEQGREIARGLTSYSADETETIRGLKSSEIAQRLGFRAHDEVIHRDDLVLTGER